MEGKALEGGGSIPSRGREYSLQRQGVFPPSHVTHLQYLTALCTSTKLEKIGALSLVIFVFICFHHSWNGVGCIISCCCFGLFVCLFVLPLLVIVRSLRMSVTINGFLSYLILYRSVCLPQSVVFLHFTAVTPAQPSLTTPQGSRRNCDFSHWSFKPIWVNPVVFYTQCTI